MQELRSHPELIQYANDHHEPYFGHFSTFPNLTITRNLISVKTTYFHQK